MRHRHGAAHEASHWCSRAGQASGIRDSGIAMPRSSSAQPPMLDESSAESPIQGPIPNRHLASAVARVEETITRISLVCAYWQQAPQLNPPWHALLHLRGCDRIRGELSSGLGKSSGEKSNSLLLCAPQTSSKSRSLLFALNLAASSFAAAIASSAEYE